MLIHSCNPNYISRFYDMIASPGDQIYLNCHSLSILILNPENYSTSSTGVRISDETGVESAEFTVNTAAGTSHMYIVLIKVCFTV